MSRLIFVIGETGTGKSYSLKNMNPKDTLILNCIGKDMPFRQWSQKWGWEEGRKYNYYATTNWEKIVQLMMWASEKRPSIKNIVIDDFQYVMSFEYLQNLEKDVWETFRNIGGHVFQIVNTARNLRKDLNVFILTHSETIAEAGLVKKKAKTVGKMTDEKITLEGLATVVLYTEVTPDPETGRMRYQFVTQNDGSSTAKSPEDMFPHERIPNDLSLVIKNINEYF